MLGPRRGGLLVTYFFEHLKEFCSQLIQCVVTLKLAGDPCRRQKGRGQKGTIEAGSPHDPPFLNWRGTGWQWTL